MAFGATIVVESNPNGIFTEGTISGTPKPGTLMELTGTAFVGGRGTWQAFSGSTGTRCLVAVLREDEDTGADATTAYVSGKRGFLYIARPGDLINFLAINASGTASSDEGQKFQAQTTTGYLTPLTSTNYVIAQSQEVIAENASTPTLTAMQVW